MPGTNKSKKITRTTLCFAVVLLSIALAVIAFDGCGGSRRHGQKAESRSEESLECHCDSTLPGSHEPLEWDEMAQLVKMKTPKYPKSAKKRGIQGTVWVEVLVNADGTASRPCVWKSSGYEILDRAALETATKNKYKPAMNDGKPIDMWVAYRVDFVNW